MKRLKQLPTDIDKNPPLSTDNTIAIGIEEKEQDTAAQNSWELSVTNSKNNVAVQAAEMEQTVNIDHGNVLSNISAIKSLKQQLLELNQSFSSLTNDLITSSSYNKNNTVMPSTQNAKTHDANVEKT